MSDHFSSFEVSTWDVRQIKASVGEGLQDQGTSISEIPKKDTVQSH